MLLPTDKELFCNALIAAQEQFFSDVPSEDEITLIPSERFMKRVDKLVSAQKHSYWKYVNSVGKKVAIIVLAFLTLFGSVLSVKAIREPVFQFISETWDSFTRLFTSETINTASSETEIKTVFTIPASLIPDGFSETSHSNDLSSCFTVWNNGVEEITLTQNLISADITINTENAELKKIKIDAQDAYFCSNKGISTIVWNDGAYSFVLSSPERISIEELSNILMNLVEK